MLKLLNIFVITIMLLTSCVSTISTTRPPSASQTGPRIIILDNKKISAEDVGGFTSWYCRDYVHEEKGVLLEFGYFNDPDFAGVGFILYDGGYTGEFTYYQKLYCT
jgi:hypothetical protein